MKLSPKHEHFLKGQDTCRIATVGPTGYPHCVPVGYFYYKQTVYIPTVKKTKKVRNILANPKCSVIVDILEKGKGRGLMFQGQAGVARGPAFSRLKRLVERRSGWHLDRWEIVGNKPDAIIVFSPKTVIEIGTV
jgi:nitroimidazol reductase NimA-like FMN-containing flavoprotein (pyridoxamine 5'-phosphate oxidase superfamily)